MDVDDAHREGVEQDVGQQAHEAREDDALDAPRAERVDHGGVERAPIGVAPCGRRRRPRRRPLARGRAPGAGHVRDDDGDPRVEAPRARWRRGWPAGSSRCRRRGRRARSRAGHSTRSSNGRSGRDAHDLAHARSAPRPAPRARRARAPPSAAATTKTKPDAGVERAPHLGLLDAPPRWMRSKTGARGQRASMRRPRPSGRTRGRLPGRPPPVMWLIARTSTPAASSACTWRA